MISEETGSRIGFPFSFHRRSLILLMGMKNAEPSRQIHEMLAGLPRHCSGFHAADLPENGIYFFYESGEVCEGRDRIVRVGTHTGEDRLPKRLSLHFEGTA